MITFVIILVVVVITVVSVDVLVLRSQETAFVMSRYVSDDLRFGLWPVAPGRRRPHHESCECHSLKRMD